MKIEFQNQDKVLCSSEELNTHSRLNSLGTYMYKYSTVQNCYFAPEDQVQFRIVTQIQSGLFAHDEICLDLVELDVMRVRFSSTGSTCAEGEGGWQAMTSTSPTCG